MIEEKILSKLPNGTLNEFNVMNAINNDFLNPTGIRKRCLTAPQKGKPIVAKMN